MKKYMPLEGLRWSRDSGSALCDTPQNSRSRTGWGGLSSVRRSAGFEIRRQKRFDLFTGGFAIPHIIKYEYEL